MNIRYDKQGMKKKTGIFAVLLFSMIALGTAQSYTLTDADSNLTDTELTADFSGLPADTELEIQSLGDDTTTLQTFTTSSAGTATVTWRHNPFEDGTALVSDGWTYAVRSSDGSTNWEFEVAHGNMLTGLDTFNNGNLNNEIFSTTQNSGGGDCSNGISENNGALQLSGGRTGGDFQSCETAILYESSVSGNEVFVFDINSVSSTGGSNIYLELFDTESTENNINSFPISETGRHKVYYDSSNGEIVYTSNGDVVNTYTTSTSTFRPQFQWYVSSGSDGFGDLSIDSISKVPQISNNAWASPTQFDPATESLLFGNFLVNQDGTSGLEYSNDGSSWSTTPPSDGEHLYYRNTGSGTLGAVAVDTSELLGGLEFNPLQPNNNTASVVEENASLSQEFVYEFLYERSDCSEYAGLLVAWTLYNEDTGEQISQSVYPSPEMTEGQCTFYREFTEQEQLPAGDYRWTTEFTESNLGVSRFFDMYFSVEEADQVPVSFDLIDPSDGADVELDNGTYQFEYSVDAEEPGNIELVIPQYEDSVRYSTSVPAGNTTQSVELNLNDDQNYDWYLTYANDTTYQSGTNSFTALDSTDNGDNGDGDNGEEEPEYDIEQMYFNFMEDFFGISENPAQYIAAILISLTLTIALAFIAAIMDLGGVLLPTVGFLTGLMFSSMIGYVPGWFMFILAVLTGGLIAKTGVGAVNE